MSRRALGLLLAALLRAGPAAAQLPQFLGSVDLGIARQHFQSAYPGGAESLAGALMYGQVGISVNPVAVDVSYAQGRLASSTASAAARSVVEASVMVSGRVTPWLLLKAGPHLRAYSAPGSTERWAMWELHAHADEPVITGVLAAYLEGWVAFTSSANVDPGASGARGGEAGVTMRIPGSLFWARLGYAVDRSSLKGGARTEALQSVLVSIGLGGR
ncbi:MAG TPA: hypothetical protein VEH83_03695 [Gemmatimonadales bacterium]|nr:hypothetical protein [Gemmatimonadales bacterium]